MDVVAAHQAGFVNAVATLGTSLTDEHAKKLARLAPTHELRARDVAVGIALAHAHQDPSVLKHLESPSRHRLPSRAKSSERSLRPSIRDALQPPQLAPICRKPAGSIAPKTQWLQYAENGLAPLCRKPSGSITPKDDSCNALLDCRLFLTDEFPGRSLDEAVRQWNEGSQSTVIDRRHYANVPIWFVVPENLNLQLP